jgi:ATP-binding cassette subfamily B multidrug efflux pump
MNAIYQWFENRIDPFAPPAITDTKGTLPTFWAFIKPAKASFIVMILLGCMRGVLNAVSFFVLGGLVDLLTSQPKPNEGHDFHLYAILSLGVAFLIFRPIVITLESLVGNQVIQGRFPSLVRWQSHRRVMGQSIDFFQKELTGAITSKVWQSGQAVSEFLGTFLQFGWSSVVYAVSTIVLLSLLDIWLGAVSAIWIGVFFWTAYKFVPLTRNRARASAEDQNIAAGLLADVYSHIQTLLLFSPKASDDSYLLNGLRTTADSLSMFYRTRSGVRIAMILLSSMSIGLITALTVVLWRHGSITVGDVALIIGLVLRLDNQLESLMGLVSGVFRAFGGFQSCMSLIAKPATLVDRPGAKEFLLDSGRIDIQNVSFGYGKDAKVLDSMSLTIEPGEKVGLVGRSGSGKSTLLHLLLRLYDVEGGCIVIDGQDVRGVTQDSLRSKFGLVAQDSSLFNRSVYENIVCGRTDVTMKEVREAARRAHALEFVEALEDNGGRRGFEAHVGERGVQLSGGQRQRIAIARVFLKNAPILLLDEATSALDSKLDADIQESLARAMHGKTVLAVAHRLSTLAHMDRLLVIESGRLVEQGTHQQLLAAGGLYSEFWLKQFNAQIETTLPPADYAIA